MLEAEIGNQRGRIGGGLCEGWSGETEKQTQQELFREMHFASAS
jgi:hypothetical protein